MKNLLTVENGHDPKLVQEFNEVASKFDEWEILWQIIERYFDDEDLRGVTEQLKEKINLNPEAYPVTK